LKEMNRASAPSTVPRIGRSTVRPGSGASVPMVVVAAAGYGKTAWVESVRAERGARVLRADEVEGFDLDGPDDGAHGVAAPTVVVEDLHRLPQEEQVALVERLSSNVPELSLVLTSREPVDIRVRSSLPGPVFDVGPRDLALGTVEISTILRDEYGLKDPELPSQVREVTSGWPTLVHLAADTLVRHPSDNLGSALSRAGSTAESWLDHEVLAPLSGEVANLLMDMSWFGVLTPDLVGRALVDVAAEGWAAEVIETLVAVGILVPHPRRELVAREGVQVVPVLRELLSARRPGASPSDSQLRRAAEWYQAHDLPFAVVEAAARRGSSGSVASLLASRGSEMIAQGDAAGIVHLVSDRTRTPPGTHGLEPEVQRTFAEALHASGRSDAALGAYAPLLQGADRHGWDAGLAARVAAVHYSQGALVQARDILDRVAREALPDDSDGIRWRSTRANVAAMLGDDVQARELAEQALLLAQRSGSPSDLTIAHQAIARTSPGSGKPTHLQMALVAARQAGDAVSIARILGNQCYTLLAAARFEDAVATSRDAVRAAEMVLPMGALVAALHNLAEALTRTGEYAEARLHLRRSVAVSQRLGPSRAAASLCGLGDVYRALGQREQGRAAYEESVRLARASHELQVLVPALAGFARLVVDEAPEEARSAAEEACDLASPDLAPYALIALGWVEVASGDRGRASVLAHEAAACARNEQALDLLAEALELSGETTDPDTASVHLLEALSIWREGGAHPEVSRIEVLLGRLDGADRSARARGQKAADQLRRLGVIAVNGRLLGDDAVGKSVTISVLGPFEVAVGGRPVPLQAWRSRQARTLVKILAGRRGRPVSRSHLSELLWPDDDPVKTSHRLSVLLATVRNVLDPRKVWPADHYISSDARGIWLDLRRVGVDADDVMVDAEHGSTLLAAGDAVAAKELFASVDDRYRGGPFEDEPGEEWAQDLREEIRAAWLRSLRHLATLAVKEGRSNDASALLTRLLSVDPYDERVHRGLVRNLVRAGRHGEARRAFERWTQAMRALDAPTPDPAELRPVTRQAPEPRLVMTPR
jgi:DNA-binding SARP family transcriptional activator/ATP/maltotriose-dependent transcriptional regulator MalT